MPTALVTGASSGLGAGFARALAKDAYDLVLTARRADRLEAMAKELQAEHSISVHVFAADLSEPDAPVRLLAWATERRLTIDLLINNAGFGARGEFADLDRGMQLGMIDLNCRALVALTHGVLPQMIERRSGSILNVASTAAFLPGPWMSVYYASKAFVLSFSEGLHEEVRDKGIHVVALCPGPTRTDFADTAGMADTPLFERLSGDADTVVQDGLRAARSNAAVKISGVKNVLSVELLRATPRLLARRIAGAMQRS